MVYIYAKIDNDFRKVVAISSIYIEDYIDAVLDEDVVDFSKINGYIIYCNDDGKNHLKFDEDKYNEYIKEQQIQEGIVKGEELKEQLAMQTILDNASDEDAYIMRYLYSTWKVDVDYKTNDKFMYEDKFYKVLQDHTSQEDWLPNTATSLYVEITDPSIEYPEFKQPTGSHDAYAKGDKITYQCEKYESLIDGNVYSPTDYPAGWKLVE